MIVYEKLWRDMAYHGYKSHRPFLDGEMINAGKDGTNTSVCLRISRRGLKQKTRF